VKVRFVKWVVHSPHGEMFNASKILVGNLKGRDYLGDLGIDERAVFE
jgi:hypothetical protein